MLLWLRIKAFNVPFSPMSRASSSGNEVKLLWERLRTLIVVQRRIGVTPCVIWRELKVKEGITSAHLFSSITIRRMFLPQQLVDCFQHEARILLVALEEATRIGKYNSLNSRWDQSCHHDTLRLCDDIILLRAFVQGTLLLSPSICFEHLPFQTCRSTLRVSGSPMLTSLEK